MPRFGTFATRGTALTGTQKHLWPTPPARPPGTSANVGRSVYLGPHLGTAREFQEWLILLAGETIKRQPRRRTALLIRATWTDGSVEPSYGLHQSKIDEPPGFRRPRYWRCQARWRGSSPPAAVDVSGDRSHGAKSMVMLFRETAYWQGQPRSEASHGGVQDAVTARSRLCAECCANQAPPWLRHLMRKQSELRPTNRCRAMKHDGVTPDGARG
jgi:hypothetical protein